MGTVVVFVCGLATVVIPYLHGIGEEYIHVKAKEESDLAGS